jgi:hypothetical protein
MVYSAHGVLKLTCHGVDIILLQLNQLVNLVMHESQWACQFLHVTLY